MYLSKYIRRCDFMDNMNTMDFNQKIDVSLRASLEATPVERNASDDLSTGSSSDGFWDLIVLYTGSPQTLQNEFPSSSFTFLLGNYAIVKISEDDIPSLAAFPQVIYIERPRQLFFEIVSARQSSCLSAIQENSSYGLTGKGILISVIDSGIDYAHPDFCNPDKTTRLVALWDQTILADPSAGRFAPAGYSQGTLFSPEQINAALQADTFEQRMELVPSTDVTGHGTHVAGIAAGNGRASGGLYRGSCPGILTSCRQTRLARSKGISKHDRTDAGGRFFRKICHRTYRASCHQPEFWKYLRLPQRNIPSGNLPGLCLKSRTH